VEAVLLSHPAVKQAYVVGVPDRERGETVVAAIELRESATATTEAPRAAYAVDRSASSPNRRRQFGHQVPR